jgi:hypothetical protein
MDYWKRSLSYSKKDTGNPLPTHMHFILQANRFHTAKTLRIWDWCSIIHFPRRIKWTLSADGYILRWEDSGALHHIHLCELGGSWYYHWWCQFFFIAMWSIPKLQRDFVIKYKWHSIPVLDMCMVLTPYLECHWVSFSVSEYVAKCTILSRVESRVTCMTRSSLVAQDAWAESSSFDIITMQQQPNSLLMELSCGMVCRCQWERNVAFREKCRSFMEQTPNN